MSEQPLPPSAREELAEAIVAAYPDPQSVAIQLWYKWGVRLREFVQTNQPTRGFVAALLEWAETEGRERELLAVLWSGKQRNPLLRALVERLIGDEDAILTRYEAPPPPDQVRPLPETRENLERIVNERSRLIDYHAFMARLAEIGRSICRVEIPDSKGSGFLIGAQSVLTNYHVVEQCIRNGIPGEDIACRFDFTREGEGREAEGLALEAAPGNDWRGPSSPFSESDITGTGSPAPGELDFAVIRLAAPVADRAPLHFPATPPIVAPYDVAFIAQHSGGDPLQIAFGVVVEMPANGLRYRYNTTTGKGASGAPVFSADAGLIGLHHAADPEANPRYNQAVPIWRIARALAAAGEAP